MMHSYPFKLHNIICGRKEIDMARITFNELRKKDVINICDGARLGNVSEVELESCNGQICSLILTKCNSFFSLKSEQKIVLPWSRLECIGDDTILVKLSQSDLDCLSQICKSKKSSSND